MRTVLITGSSRGIGKAFTEYFLSHGYNVYAGVRKLPVKSNNAQLRNILLDVEADESIKTAIEKIKAESGTLNLLINNAGLSKGSATDEHPELVSSLESLDRSKLLRMVNVNTISPLIVAKYAVPVMTTQGSFIINISSLRASYENSKDGNGNYGYSSSKLALNMMTLCLVNDLPSHISTFAVHPGSVQTDMNPHGSMQPEDSVRAIASIIDNWKPELNGKFLNYDGSPLV